MQTETHQRQRERQTPTAGMTWIPSGEFTMGSADFYPEERPVTLSLSTGSGWTRAR
jgi:formylglycine-generating enzyme required for sulfatase activity